jgi:hypothetical protein
MGAIIQMNINEKLNNMKPKDTPLLLLGYILLFLMLLLPATANAITPIDPSNNPNPPKTDPCWFTEFPCND